MFMAHAIHHETHYHARDLTAQARVQRDPSVRLDEVGTDSGLLPHPTMRDASYVEVQTAREPSR
jgi:hypothetical protein